MCSTAAGRYTVWVAATDGNATVQTDIFITIENKNRPPVCPVIYERNVQEQETLTFQFRATDPDSQDNLQLSYAASWTGASPSGVTSVVSDPVSPGIYFHFTPSFGDRGEYVLNISVSDRSIPVYTTDCFIPVNVGDILLWEQVGQLPAWESEAVVTSIVVEPSGANAPVYAGFSAFFDPISTPEPVTGYGVYVHYPLGGEWQEMNNGLGDYRVTDMQMDSQGVLFAATLSGIFRFDVNGVAWEEASNGIPHLHRNIFTLELDPQGRLWAGTGARGPLYYSDDGAVSWQATCLGDQCNPSELYPEGITEVFRVYDIATDFVNGNHILAGVFRWDGVRFYNTLLDSSDRGITWKDNDLNVQGSARVIIFDPEHSGWVYVGVDNQGIYRSEDWGENWWEEAVLLGPHSFNMAREILPISYVDYSCTVLVGTSQKGVWRSRNGGATFSVQSSGLPDPVWVRTFAVDPGTLERVFIGTDYHGVYRTVIP